jgi:hypothetical protein
MVHVTARTRGLVDGAAPSLGLTETALIEKRIGNDGVGDLSLLSVSEVF